MDDLTIAELEERAGVPRRTIYFYVQQGLLPPPRGAGLGARYDRRHLDRLAAIPRLRAAGWRLDRIRQHFSHASDADIAAILVGRVPDESTSGAARPIAFARHVASKKEEEASTPASPSDHLIAEPSPASGEYVERARAAPSQRSVGRNSASSATGPSEARPELVERYRLAPGVELLVDRAVAGPVVAQVARLLDLARQVFGAGSG